MIHAVWPSQGSGRRCRSAHGWALPCRLADGEGYFARLICSASSMTRTSTGGRPSGPRGRRRRCRRCGPTANREHRAAGRETPSDPFGRPSFRPEDLAREGDAARAVRVGRPVRHERPAVLNQLALDGVRRVVRRLEAGPVGGVEGLDADGADPVCRVSGALPPPQVRCVPAVSTPAGIQQMVAVVEEAVPRRLPPTAPPPKPTGLAQAGRTCSG